jgi:4-amino-4-deoxy-L-arabinose transferase-like glycosyltransferase
LPHVRWLLLIVVAGALLRIITLGGESMWIDEYHSLRMAQLNRIVTEGVPGDQHPPGYYLFLTTWINLGESAFWLRLPSALAGTLAILGVARIGTALNRPRLGLLAALLLAFAPLFVWYSREARMYGVVQLAWVAAILFYVLVLRRDRWLDSVGLALAHLVGLYFAYPSLALWLGQMALFPLLWVMTGRALPRLGRWLLVQVVVIAGYLPWLPYFNQQLDRSTIFRWRLPGLPLDMTLMQVMSVALSVAVLGVLMGVGVGILAARRPQLPQKIWRHSGLWAVLVVIVFVPVYAAGVIPRGLSIRRQLLVFAPPLLLLASWAILRLDRRWLTGGIAGLAVILGIATYLLPPFEDWRGAIQTFEDRQEAGDVLLLYRGWYLAPLRHEVDGALDEDVVFNIEAISPERELPFPLGTRAWVLANPRADEGAEMAEMWARLDEIGDLEFQESFSTRIELRAYRIDAPP